MPLSVPADRRPVHRRSIELQGYHREDGLWDIEAHLVDTRAEPFPDMERGELAPGTPVHDMWVRLTVDGSMVVRGAEAATDAAPFSICPNKNDAFASLVGLKLGAGWTRAVKERLGGTKGCTHLIELLGQVATTAFQTIDAGDGGVTDRRGRPFFIDGCHAWSSDGPVVARHYPRFAQAKKQ